MNKIITGMLALSMVTSMALAENKMYAGAGASMEVIEDLDNGVALELKVGMLLDNNFGVEAKLTKSVSLPKDTQEGITIEGDFTTISLFGTYNYTLTPELKMVPKIGISNFKTDLKASSGAENVSADDSNMNLAYGVDFLYAVTPATSLYVGYTIYNPEFKDETFDASHFSLGLQQNFYLFNHGFYLFI